MLAKIIIICSVAAATSATAPGYVSSAYALGSQAEHTIRGYGGLSSVSKQAKTIDSPYATVRKTDIRVTNDAGYAPLTYAHPGNTYASPAFGYHHAPAFAHGYHAGPAFAHGYHAGPAITHGYHAGPAITHGYHAPAGAITYSQPAGYGYAAAPAHATYGYASAPVHHAPLGYASRPIALQSGAVAKAVGHVPAGLGVAYSPATSVATSSFSGHGVHYGY